MIEVVNAITGKTEGGESSRLCKRHFFQKFLQLLPKMSKITKINTNKVQKQYSEAKKIRQDYQVSSYQHLILSISVCPRFTRLH